MTETDQDSPADRPNLSKDFLAGEAKDDRIPLWPADRYGERRIELLLGSPVSSIDPAARTVLLENGTRREFGSLLIATGADPVRLPVPGHDAAKVRYLRSFADSRVIVDLALNAKHAVVVGGFIGLEVAASLRTRGLAVDVVARDHLPLERVMGTDVGRFIQSIHEAHGVVFHLGQTVTALNGRKVSLSGGATLDADFVVMGVGVKPSTAVAEKAGIAIDRGIAVNEFLETAFLESSPPATSRAGLIRTPASGFVLNTSSWPSVKVRWPRVTCWAGVSPSTPCPSSGASTTT